MQPHNCTFENLSFNLSGSVIKSSHCNSLRNSHNGGKSQLNPIVQVEFVL